MKSILVIHIYFGKFPSFFDLWLKSCEANEDVDFLIVTDNVVRPTSQNVKVFNTTLQEISRRVESVIGFAPALKSPRKLCDFKALFGDILKEYTAHYDFWGYCDSDLIFGKIRDFITDEILSNYDYVLGMGHFHIQRTSDPKFTDVWKTAKAGGYRNIYSVGFDFAKFDELDNGPEWEAVFKSEGNLIFDELPYGVSARYYKMYPEKFWSGYSIKGRCFDDVDPLKLHFSDLFNCYDTWKTSSYAKLSGFFPIYRRENIGEDEVDNVIYEYNKGRLLRIGVNQDGKLVTRELLYVHFLHRKLNIKTKKHDHYLIAPNSFRNYVVVTPPLIRHLSDNFLLRMDDRMNRVVKQLKRSKRLWQKIVARFR